MASKIPVSSSPAASKYREKLQRKDTGEIKENPKFAGPSRMQLRNKKVLVNSTTKRIRSQTVTKSESSVKKEPTKDNIQSAPKTPEPASQGAAAEEVRQELSQTVTKKPASLAKKERKCPAGRIPILGLGCSTPTLVHHDFPADEAPAKPSKLKTPTSTRVFRESKQFSPAHSPQVTPKRLSLLHVTCDKENTPPPKPSPNIMTVRPSPTLNSAQQPNQPSGKPKSQLPRRLKAPRTSKSSKQPKRTETYSLSSATSTSSIDGDRTTDSAHGEGEVCPAGGAEIATGTYSLEKKDLNKTKDVTRFEPLTQSTPKENVPPVIHEGISQAKINILLEKKDLYVTRDMTGFQPLTQSTPIDPEPPVSIEQVIPVAAIKVVPNKKNLPDAATGNDDGYETSSMNRPSLIPKSSQQEDNVITNTVQTSPSNASTVSSHNGTRGNSSKEASVSEEADTLRPIVTRVTSSIVLPSTVSYTPSVLNISHGQISTPQLSTISVPSNRHQSGYPQEHSDGQVTMCTMHYAGRQLVPVSAHSAPLCAYRTVCHTPVTTSQAPTVQSTISKPCVCLFPDSQPDVLPTTQMRPSTFADPSLAHLTGKHIRKTSVVRAVTTQPLLLVSQSEDRLDAAADLEVECLTQGSPRVAVDPHRMVVNPIASGLDGDFRKYTFQPIHVPSRRVLQNEGSAFRRILIC